MIIRKKFKFEGSHIVRNCSSTRCAHSIHGHSYIVEVFVTSDRLDSGGMVVDFGLLKKTIGTLVDAFDHAMVFWSQDDVSYVSAMQELNMRWVKIPVNASAENYALLFVAMFQLVLDKVNWKNGEKGVSVHSVRVHETATGYAEASLSDLLKNPVHKYLDVIKFSPGIMSEFPHSFKWENFLLPDYKWENPEPYHQV